MARTLRKTLPFLLTSSLVLLLGGVSIVVGWSPIPVKDDPLVRHPGTQPDTGVTLEAPNRCLNCHAGYNSSTEPGFNWQGSMMAQAQRDFLYLSCLTVAAQDSLWAVGTPNATDICIRCHSPAGWLGGRSDPTNASGLTGDDWDGVSCDFCHRMYDPFFVTTFNGNREGSDPDYWDETDTTATDSSSAAQETYLVDAGEAQAVRRFNGSAFFTPEGLPDSATYTEAASGQYFVGVGSQKRAPFADAAARHKMLYSRFHKSRYFCATCHDVSNPVLANLGKDPTQPLPTETSSAYTYTHVERTFSEFMLSDYGQQGGAEGIGPFAPDVFATSLPDNRIGKCQDCHMRDVVGVACDKKGVPVRPDESQEHPASGLPLHDLTGGNAWVPWILASTVPGSPNFDATNETLLRQGPQLLTLDLEQGLGLDPAALLAAVDRAKQQLELAASIDAIDYAGATGELTFRVQNRSGHKLISGFPEGRRMFLNIEFYSAGSLVHEVNPYDVDAGTLKGIPGSAYFDPDGQLNPPGNLLDESAVYVDELVYEMHPTSTLTGETETFHFALATGRYKDNRIPPKGFRIDQAAARLSLPVWHGANAPDYFTAEEYLGGYDEVTYVLPTAIRESHDIDAVEVDLYYQTTSREYIEFLRDEINGYAHPNPLPPTLSSPTNSGEPEAYVVQTDPWFDQLRRWGDTLWQIWKHNMNVDGARPIEMASAEWGNGSGSCEASAPGLLTAQAGHQQVTLTWTKEHTDGDAVPGYFVYYDQAAKGQFIAGAGLATTYTDAGLTDGQQYCYKVSYATADCESEFSNVLCATPQPGATGVGVVRLETGDWIGKGKSKKWTEIDSFAQGDDVTFRALVSDQSGQPVPEAVVTLAIDGSASAVVTTGPSDANGWAEGRWRTTAPGKRSSGTPTGTYTATTAGVSADGYSWDEVATSFDFSIH